MLMQQRIAACGIRHREFVLTPLNLQVGDNSVATAVQPCPKHARWDISPGSSLDDSREQLSARVKIAW